MKRLVFSLCFVAVSAAYVVQQKQSTSDPTQADAGLLGDPLSGPSSASPADLGSPSPAIYRVQPTNSRTTTPPAGIIKVASSAGPGYADGEFTGPAVNAYYGVVQIQAVVQSGRLARLRVLQYPSDRQTSIAINRQALPILRDEAIAAQTASVDTVSGATLTSQAFIRSLAGALNLAH